MRKRWLFIPVLVGLLAIGVTGGIVAAQGSGPKGDSPMQSFVSRVAAILDLDETQVQAAFDQASRELQDEVLERRLDRMVENGRLSQEEANKYLEWYQSRPEGRIPGLRPRGFGGRGFMGQGMRGGHGFRGMKFFQDGSPEPPPEITDSTSL